MRTGAPARALAEPNHRIGNAPSLQALGLGRGHALTGRHALQRYGAVATLGGEVAHAVACFRA